MHTVFVAMILSLTTVNAFAAELKSEELRALIADKMSTKLSEIIELDSNTNLAQVDPVSTKMDIQSSSTVNKEVISMVIAAEGIIESYDFDFGDPVDEYSFQCETIIVKDKNKNQGWIVNKIKCEFDKM